MPRPLPWGTGGERRSRASRRCGRLRPRPGTVSAGECGRRTAGGSEGWSLRPRSLARGRQRLPSLPRTWSRRPRSAPAAPRASPRAPARPPGSSLSRRAAPGPAALLSWSPGACRSSALRGGGSPPLRLLVLVLRPARLLSERARLSASLGGWSEPAPGRERPRSLRGCSPGSGPRGEGAVADLWRAPDPLCLLPPEPAEAPGVTRGWWERRDRGGAGEEEEERRQTLAGCAELVHGGTGK